jgi:peptidoglycan/LPS O-acetylase OafA/YrhL
MSGTTSIETAGSSRLLGLDILRLLAVVMVIGHHMEQPPSDLSPIVKAGCDAWWSHGGLGVDLFFVLSGLLVSGLLFSEYKKHGEISVTRFYMRRGWKIYPAFYFLLGFTFLYQLLVVGYKMRDRPFFSELFFIQSYQAAFWNHTWTLAVEEHFYVLLPLLLLFLVRRNRGATDPFRAVPYVVAATCVAVLATRIVNFQLRTEYSYLTHVFPTHLRMDALFFGVALGYLYHFHSEWFFRTLRPWRYALLVVGTALLSMALIVGTPSNFYIHTFGFTQHFLGAAAIVVGTLMCQIPRNLLTATLATLGSYSYSIYLWHMAIFYWGTQQMKDAGFSWGLRQAIFLVGAFVIGIAMAKLVELPTLRIRDRWFPSRSAGPILSTLAVPETAATPSRQAA